MPTFQSLDELIANKAEEFADQIKAAAAMADKEEEIRIEAEKQLAFIQKEAGIKLEGKHEFTVASGRVDSVYDRVIIEYKNPSSPAARIGPKADSPGTKKVVEQIKKRFYDLRQEHGQALNSLFGVGLDGNHFVFVRYRDDKWQVQDPVEVNKHSAQRFLWALFNLGWKGKAFSPEYLAGDFGSEAKLAQDGIRILYEAVLSSTHPKTQTFFQQWKILYSEVCGYDVDNPSDKMKELAEFYAIPVKGLQPAELLFALHTYYAIFMKLLAAEIISFFRQLPSPLQKMIQAPTSNKLRSEAEDLEAGSVFRHLNITNFLEGDIFAWYVAAWSEPVETLIRGMVGRLDNYNPGTLSEDPSGTRDLLKKLYHELFPKSVRHDLGEYYTPDWLADHVLDELKYSGDPDKRLLDPACGSGTFLVMAINRIRRWYEEHREDCHFDEGDLGRKILANVVGFDLNPIAVMAARTNYLIAIRDLIPRLDKVEIPVYLCDSIVTPTEYGDLFAGAEKTAKVPCSACKPPHLLVPKEIAASSDLVAKYADALQHCIEVELAPDDFIQHCVDESIPVTEANLHRVLYQELLTLQAANKNGVWARIIKNAFAPLFAGRFDYVAGNPPWVNWEHLPADYRKLSAGIWQKYKLQGPLPIKKRQQSDQAKTDVSILMTYVSVDKYLGSGGKLGFVITRSVFQSELGGWHFRSFKLPDGTPLRVKTVNDLNPLKPFQGQAGNVTSTFVLLPGKKTDYPVPWKVWRLKEPGSVDEDTNLSDVLTHTERLPWTARPIDPHQNQSAWIFGDEVAIGILFRTLKPSYYAPYAREGVNTRGANGVFFADVWLNGHHLLIANRPQDGDDSHLQRKEQSIEADYVYPLLRGKDVRRWYGNPSQHILMPHDGDSPTDAVTFTTLPKKTQEFLSKFKQKLTGRKKFRNFDPSGKDWYGLYSVLDATFSPYKVVWREMAGGAIAAVIDNAKLPSGEVKLVIPDHKLFLIPCKSLAEAHFVSGIFNSVIGTYLIKSYAISTGISTHVLDRLPIPEYDRDNKLHKEISTAARHCASAAEKEDDLEELEDDLDHLVAKLLEITDKELGTIHKALKEIAGPEEVEQDANA